MQTSTGESHQDMGNSENAEELVQEGNRLFVFVLFYF